MTHKGTPPEPPNEPAGAPTSAGIERRGMAHAGHLEEGLESASPWYQWGPYVSERAWGRSGRTTAPVATRGHRSHDHALARVPLERGRMAGISDLFGRLNLGLALWNGRDPILKERMFGLTNSEGTTARTSRNTGGTSTLPSSAAALALPLPPGGVSL